MPTLQAVLKASSSAGRVARTTGAPGNIKIPRASKRTAHSLMSHQALSQNHQHFYPPSKFPLPRDTVVFHQKRARSRARMWSLRLCPKPEKSSTLYSLSRWPGRPMSVISILLQCEQYLLWVLFPVATHCIRRREFRSRPKPCATGQRTMRSRDRSNRPISAQLETSDTPSLESSVMITSPLWKETRSPEKAQQSARDSAAWIDNRSATIATGVGSVSEPRERPTLATAKCSTILNF